jgi:hypothetical protein
MVSFFIFEISFQSRLEGRGGPLHAPRRSLDRRNEGRNGERRSRGRRVGAQLFAHPTRLRAPAPRPRAIASANRLVRSVHRAAA